MFFHSTRYTLTTSFLIAAAGILFYMISNFNFINAYVDDYQYERAENDDIPDIFLIFDASDIQKITNVEKKLSQLPNFLDSYDTDCNKYVVRLALLDEWKHVKPQLMSSKYSSIDRTYVTKFFNPGRLEAGTYKKSINWQILTADNELKLEIEKSFNVKLDEGAEVWDKFQPTKEIFRYESKQLVKNADADICSDAGVS